MLHGSTRIVNGLGAGRIHGDIALREKTTGHILRIACSTTPSTAIGAQAVSGTMPDLLT